MKVDSVGAIRDECWNNGLGGPLDYRRPIETCSEAFVT